MTRPAVRILAIPAAMLLSAACGGEPAEAPKTLEELAADKCPTISLDKPLGEFVIATGDPKVRMKIVQHDGATHLWFTDPSFSNFTLDLVGTKRDKDWKFEEKPRGKRKTLVEQGGEAAKRVYVQPHYKACNMHVYAGVATPDGKEIMPPNPVSFAPFPEGSGVVFSFAPIDEPVFLGEAARDKAKADAQLAELGEPRPDVDRGTIAVATWVPVDADGDVSCTYTFDAYFDGQQIDGGADLPAEAPADGLRRYAHTFEAPYTGNHRFELHRKRTCNGSTELIAVAGIDAILN